MNNQTLVNILDDAQDLALIENLGGDRFVYAAKLSLQAQRKLYDLSVSNIDDQKIKVYKEDWRFDDEDGITGSSTFLALRFDSMALRPNALWLPGLREAKELETQGKLENGVYRDYGIIIYNDEGSNQDIAKSLITKAQALKFENPLIIPFRNLNPISNNTFRQGIELSFVESPEGIIFGEEAKKKINLLQYKANSGAHGLLRSRHGWWYANRNDLDSSLYYGRVDWVCGEATRVDLKEALGSLIGRRKK